MPTELKTLRSSQPHSGQTVSGASVNFWKISKS